jgi:hypothetical protein
MDYTTLPLADVRKGLEDIVRETKSTFGGYDAQQLNWQPDATQWSVAQCFEHLLMANRLMFQAAEDALNGTAPPSIWRRLPVLPRVFGWMLVRSQSPETRRRFTASPGARPATSDIAVDVIPRFIQQHYRAVERLQALDEGEAARSIMSSPFVTVITYSVLDGWRLVFAHDRRHFEQARRVTLSPGFPGF